MHHVTRENPNRGLANPAHQTIVSQALPDGAKVMGMRGNSLMTFAPSGKAHETVAWYR